MWTRRTPRTMAAVLALSMTLAGGAMAADEPAADERAADEPTADWTYEGDTDPEHWAALDAAYALCGSGMEQSPIDIPAGTSATIDHAPADYLPSDLVIENNGHAIEVDYEPGSSILIDGIAYELVQLHFHSPSEHAVAGERADMEMHLVHASPDGALAVVGVLIVEGAENAAFDPIWEVMPAEEGEPIAIAGVVIDADDLLPGDRSFVTYPGSLTTPPCSEGVTWRLLAEPVELSTEQLAAYRALHDGTNRPLQPLHDRSLE